MKVTGFSFIRNAEKFDYPIVEAITSILPICDEFILALGNSEDNTLEIIKSINSDKIKIIPTVWDDALREGGKTLAIETNKAFDAVASDSDWAFYIQGDEVIHEKYLDIIYEAMKQYKDDLSVDGLLFNYKHFFGSYDYIGNSRSWYRKEIRVIRNNKTIRSYKDAQGFRKISNEKLRVKQIDACVNHYGWVKDPFAQQRKQENFNKLWHDDQWVKKHVGERELFDYSGIDSLKEFKESHPQVMQKRISEKNWKFDFNPSDEKLSLKNKVLMKVEKYTGWRIGEYRNYKII
jgi:hypothetical protein